MKKQYMIQDFPQLVKYFAAKNPVHLLLFVVPLWSTAAYFAFHGESSIIRTLLAVLAGALYWSFLEYAIHRFMYHSRYPFRWMHYFLGSFHAYHHSDMSDHRVLNAGFLMVYLVTPTVLSPFLLITSDWQLLSSLALGLISAHYFYEWVHYTLHLKVHDTGYLNYIQKYHFHHHDRAPLKNFGNTSHLWDVVFGTYDGNYKTYVMPAQSRKTLIEEKTQGEVVLAQA